MESYKMERKCNGTQMEWNANVIKEGKRNGMEMLTKRKGGCNKMQRKTNARKTNAKEELMQHNAKGVESKRNKNFLWSLLYLQQFIRYWYELLCACKPIQLSVQP